MEQQNIMRETKKKLGLEEATGKIPENQSSDAVKKRDRIQKVESSWLHLLPFIIKPIQLLALYPQTKE